MTIETQFADALVTIASGFGIAAERVFGMFVNAQMMIGILDIVSAFVMIVGGYVIGKFARKACVNAWRNDDGTWDDSDDRGIATAVPIIIGLMAMLIIGLFTDWLSIAVLKLVCPEYSAMKEVISLVMP